MKLHELELKNFKCFESLRLEFHPRFNVLLGVNGVGKTSILEALRVSIGSLYLGLDKYEDRIASPGISNDDIRLKNMEQQFPSEVIAVGEFEPQYSLMGASVVRWKRQVETRGGKTLYKDASDMMKLSRMMQQSVRDGREENIPLVAYFSTDRYKKERRDVKVEPNGSRLRGYYNALDQSTNSKFFLNLYATETMDELQTGKKSPMLAAVNQAIKKCVQCEDVVYILKEQELFLNYADGTQMPFHLLSDGVRCTLAMVMEIAFRCHLLNPHLGVAATDYTTGVVLIDEIDLHLHPAWQKHVASDLRRAFPMLQFIVTTHAPLVLSSLEDCLIYSIADGQAYSFPAQYGRDANYILDEMGVHGMSEELQQKLDDYKLMLERGDYANPVAGEMRAELEERLGKNHPELKRADLILSFFKAD